jgi:hypothetical protein
MSTESQLREKLRKIEALFAGAGTAGERLAAEAALERVRERLTELGRQDPSIEMQFSMPDQWSRHLFLALCRRYGMKPYRYYRQRRNTVMVRAPKRFLDQVLWPEFSELDQALQAYLHQVTLRVIREEATPTRARRRRFPRRCRRTDGRCGQAARLTLFCWAHAQGNNSSIFAIGQPLTSLVRMSARYGFGSMPCSFAVSISEAMHAQLIAP